MRCTAGTSHATTGIAKEALRAKAATKKNPLCLLPASGRAHVPKH